MITAEFSAKLGQHREISRKSSGTSRDEELKRLGPLLTSHHVRCQKQKGYEVDFQCIH